MYGYALTATDLNVRSRDSGLCGHKVWYHLVPSNCRLRTWRTNTVRLAAPRPVRTLELVVLRNRVVKPFGYRPGEDPDSRSDVGRAALNHIRSTPTTSRISQHTGTTTTREVDICAKRSWKSGGRLPFTADVKPAFSDEATT